MLRKIILGFSASLLLLGAGCIDFGGSAPVVLGVFRSADKGETWSQINALPTPSGVKSLNAVSVYRIFTDPSDTNALYLATRGQGLFFTYDRGDSWKAVPFMQGKFIFSLGVDPSDKCVIYATDGNNIFKTIDCSRSWSTVYLSQSGSRIAAIAIDYFNKGNIFAGLEDGTILQSINAGSSWRATTSTGGTLRELVADPQIPGRLYLAKASTGLFISNDNGQNWQDVSHDLRNFSEGLTFYRLILDQTRKNSLYWLSKYGIFHSMDSGKTWSDLKLVTAPGTVNIYNFALNPKNPQELFYTGTILSGQSPADSLSLSAPAKVSSSKLYKSIDGGATWFNRKLPSSAIPVNLLIYPDDPRVVFLGFTVAQ